MRREAGQWEAEAEGARMQCAVALREKALLKTEITNLAEKLAASQSERAALDHADARVKQLIQDTNTIQHQMLTLTKQVCLRSRPRRSREAHG